MDKLQQWVEKSKQLKKLKAEEMALRKDICAAILEGMSLPATKKIETPLVEVTAKNGVSHNVDEAVLDQVYSQLDTAEKGALKWKPSIVMKQYKALPDSSLLHEAIIVKPSAPTLKVVSLEEG